MWVTTFLWGAAFGVGAWAIFYSRKFWFKVEEGHVAILTNHGACIKGSPVSDQKLKVLDPGLHTKLPWYEAHHIPVMEQAIDLAVEEENMTAMAGDGTLLRLDSKLRFTPLPEKLYQYVFSLKRPASHLKGLFICLQRNEIANFDSSSPRDVTIKNSSLYHNDSGGSYALLRQERQKLNKRIESFCRQKISDNYGLKFNGVDLVDILPPHEIENALNAVFSARAEADALSAKAQSECEQKILAAEKSVEIAQAKADAAAVEISIVGGYLLDLEQKDFLDAYLDRRRKEVASGAGKIFLQI